MRDYQIYDNRVTLYRLEPFKNHAAIHYKRRVVKCWACNNRIIKGLRASIWRVLGF
jgi:hypothetical protein